MQADISLTNLVDAFSVRHVRTPHMHDGLYRAKGNPLPDTTWAVYCCRPHDTITVLLSQIHFAKFLQSDVIFCKTY